MQKEWSYLRQCIAWMAFFLVLTLGPPLFAQVSSTAGVPIETGNTSEWGGSLIWAFFSTSALEWLKRNQKFSFFAEKTAKIVQRSVGILMSVAAALGVHATFDSQAGTFMVTGLLLPSMWALCIESVRQWVIQELTYRTAVKNYGKETVTHA